MISNAWNYIARVFFPIKTGYLLCGSRATFPRSSESQIFSFSPALNYVGSSETQEARAVSAFQRINENALACTRTLRHKAFDFNESRMTAASLLPSHAAEERA